MTDCKCPFCGLEAWNAQCCDVIVRFPKSVKISFSPIDIVQGDFSDEVKYHLGCMAMLNKYGHRIPVGKSWGGYEKGKYNWSSKRISENEFRLCFHALETGQTIPELEKYSESRCPHNYWETAKYFSR